MNQIFNDELKDKLIGISTTGRDDKSSDDTHSPYEPTAYAVLDKILQEGYISDDNTLVDFGCGKGRVSIYLSVKCGCNSLGIDMEKRFVNIAEENLRNVGIQNKVSFVCGMAEELEITEAMDRFYFFNPFSYDIFRKILDRITDSFYDCPRQIYLFFYYPSDEYMGRLMTEQSLMFVDELDCQTLFDGKDEREKVVLFEVI